MGVAGWEIRNIVERKGRYALGRVDGNEGKTRRTHKAATDGPAVDPVQTLPPVAATRPLDSLTSGGIETQVTFLCWCALHAETHQRECGGSAVSQKHSVITPAVADPPHSLQQAQHQGQTSVRLFSRSNRANGRNTYDLYLTHKQFI
ncbi:unnamed protein product [Clonostachys rhizophaga]|uniref:Uncharacterized protein n=1 Tax=Clonostachys rhizophaga TaxID=160324 RepID=A0A9N9YP73_9HYPO|nr:unnamed protein product [Clonostachys rhizophaga]